MQGFQYQGRFVFRYLHIIFLSLLFSIVFLVLSLFTNTSFIVLFLVCITVSYSFAYLSLPDDIIISDAGFCLKRKLFKKKKIFDIDKITEINELEHTNKPSLFSILINLFSNLSILSIYQDPISCVLEITNINLITFRIYSYQTIHYNEIKSRLETIVSSNRKYDAFN